MLKFYFVLLATTFLVFFLAFWFRKKPFSKVFYSIFYVLVVFIAIELACIAGFRIGGGFWTFKKQPNPNAELFEAHPYFVGFPKKNVSITVNGHTYSHNSDGFRCPEIPSKSKKTRIFAVGGSTTYGVGVNDDETWPHYLNLAGGSNYEVFNLGISGYSSLEDLILCATMIKQYQPDFVLIHTGINDLRNSFAPKLRSDYSDFHAPSLYKSLGLGFSEKIPPVASLLALEIILQKLHLAPVDYPKTAQPTIHDQVDTHALSIYKNNLITLSSVIKAQGAVPVFVPQVLLFDQIKGGKMQWWIPGLSDIGLIRSINEFNNAMHAVAKSEKAIFCWEIINFKWKPVNFCDPSHLNPQGNLLFAEILKRPVEKAIQLKYLSGMANKTNNETEPKP